ncbi:PepSY domain-containing protein [Cohaesibacter gelatinilyticus]|uniref:Sulfite reductase (NADPH) flavoprotein alpha-component n=1 Tax=Cohaesibacter gelatinilyticus TaxID=372072 RepID=A0A285NE86_9HYPH|nr:PepSY domain-containing protein [Cohaesibacter gelatinilyticus]SNZ07608.1 sulfite reductase (NADPH) flavoprotein alpha-component [Cohaesibacter gelatinilyticus]
MRLLHSYLGLGGVILACFLAITGALLSLQPALDASSVVDGTGAGDVAVLAGLISEQVPQVERIERKASGQILAHANTDEGPLVLVINPETGVVIGPNEASGFFGMLAELHREMFIGDAGRMLAGFGAGTMLLLSVSGLFLLKRRCGSWSQLLRPAKGEGVSRLHVEVSRLALPGLLLTSFTALYLSLASFELVSTGQTAMPAFPEQMEQGEVVPVSDLSSLQTIKLENFRELIFPFPGDLSDPYTLTTDQGMAYIDPVSGKTHSFAAFSVSQQIYEFIYSLHSGQGMWWLGVLLGLSSLSVPALSLTGLWMWHKRASGAANIGETDLSDAGFVILVGSEGNSTWSFADSLKTALGAHGNVVHCAKMNDVSDLHLADKHVFILTSTYGDGQSPASADIFLNRMKNLQVQNARSISVLGFGDEAFAHYCQFAKDVDQHLTRLGARSLTPLGLVNKRSLTDFGKWADQVGKALGQELVFEHKQHVPMTTAWQVISRKVYGSEFSEPTIILRLVPPAGLLHQTYATGDLIGIVAAPGVAPRYYSLASSSKEGYLEVCVKRHRRGICSTYLHSLRVGDQIDGFIKENPAFKPSEAPVPKILIGAGTGIAPLAGFARAGQIGRDTHLYWGGRHPQSDFLFRDDLMSCRQDGRLAGLRTAFSRFSHRQYVQDKIREDSSLIQSLVLSGGQILICGGQAMARDVRATLEEILRPLGLNVETLKQSRRYLEDVY